MRITSWRGKVGIALSLLLWTAGAASAAKVAIFEIEIERMQQEGFSPAYIADENRRIAVTTERLRRLFRQAGWEVLDIAPVAGRAAGYHLQACGNCADDLAAELGADYAVTTQVYRVSTLILSLQVVIRKVQDRLPVLSARIDLRGNTDKAWQRAVDYIFENRIAPAIAGIGKR